MIDKSLEFSTQIINTDNQYDRLPATTKARIQRTCAGKIGELAFLELLKEKEKNIDVEKIEKEMFEIYEGQNEVDSYDFITKTGETIDIKAGFRDIHKRVMVNQDQLNKNHKDYYVGVKLNGKDTDFKNKLIDIYSITEAKILGYVEYKFLMKMELKNYGEGMARAIFYNQLMGIDKLLEKF